MKLSKTYLCVTIAVIVLAFVLVCRLLSPPEYKPGISSYPADAAITMLKEFAGKPHSSAEQEELAEVRNYLIGRLNDMGLKTNVNTYTADNWFGQYEVNNITAQIDGQGNAPYILIMAHYDSVIEDLNMNISKSTGAADDGYGVITLLQIAEHFSKDDKQLINGIKFLITDSEETGPLEGSKAEIEKNSDFYSDISLIISIEARGFDGPVLMFQTNKGNSRVLDLYSKANKPFTSSVLSDLFTLMPNFTDLSPFLEAGYPGMNFAALGHMKYYHSEEDNLDNANIDTINHYGEQLMPIVTEFVSNGKYSDVDYFRYSGDSTYFTILPGLFVSYGNIFNTVLLFVCAAALTAIVMLGSKNSVISKKQFFVCIARWLLYLLAFVIAGAMAVVLIALLNGLQLNPMAMWNFTFDTPALIAFIAIMIACSAAIVKRQAKNHEKIIEALAGGIALNLIMAIIFALIFPGITYLFLLPALASSIIAALQLKEKHRAAKIAAPAVLFIIIILCVPVFHTLYYALTIGSLFVFALLLACPLSLFMPLVFLGKK